MMEENGLFYFFMKHIFFSFFLLFFFSGCIFSGNENTENNPENTSATISNTGIAPIAEDPLRKMLLEARGKESPNADTTLQTASLILEKQVSTSGKITVSIILKNPKLQPITSVQSWIAYPVGTVKGESILLPKNSLFQLVAPGEKDFDTKLGLAKIGVSIPEGVTFSDPETEIATITFTREKEGMVSLEFFNPGDIGNTRIMSITDGGTKNILNQANINSVIIP